ncbi:uncharacterized protein LOC100880872 [Megachile rotundata]|uniref:uncharacterized protein LOC100880872 n=1 Tax=Megachile rotundata TaxID=143995 RepID=UPI000614DA9F|nr:PREDICTED: GATA zinc finger domain-containing protein 14 [Megachile rotundata]XP_012144417.1 PREDICTED: GATA zinc finger domain-containing protein 14 [Megachile rotundata]XP_012144418.1 PREDICTED: GATA zinc finger domain-containing protein 14 [Megachile rotundata]
MTRYARAKGSKASNERAPNDATPWHVMKQQLVENLSVAQECSKKTKSAKELLHEEKYTSNVAKNNNSEWAEFESNCERQNSSVVEKIKKKHNKQHLSTTENDHNMSSKKSDESGVKVTQKLLKRSIDVNDDCTTEVKSKKYKKMNSQDDNINEVEKKLDQVDTKVDETDSNTNKLNKKRNNNKYNTTEESTKMLVESNDNSQIKDNETNHTPDLKNKIQGVLSKRQKRNLKKRQNIASEAGADTNSENFSNSNDRNYSTENNQTKRFNNGFATQSMNFRNVPHQFGKKTFQNNKRKQKPPKIRDDKEHKRRKPDVGYSKMVINGVEVEIVKFDGFPVKKEDADRLHELKQKMIMKGIPEKDINAAMKLERRKAEKALARIKKCVCFHCRKSGHNLSDCPELQSEQAGTGICFKCGSTEHTHFECKVAKPTEFRYATCFICREQGHIAKQCPDNPKGVYPQGGCCKICGDVTHLKKDCPDLIKEKEENTITVNTIANTDIESLENSKIVPNEKDDKSKKIVKF